MAMGGFDRDDLHAPLAEINTTPLVDVMLVLMVIFLVTAPMLTQTIKLELPNETATEMKNPDAITISIDKEGHYYWGKEPITEAQIEQRFKAAVDHDPKQPVHLRADNNVVYGKVSHILATAQRVGLKNVGFITEPK